MRRAVWLLAVLLSACAHAEWTVALGRPALGPDRQIAVSIQTLIEQLPPTTGCLERPASATLRFEASPAHEQVARYELIVTKPTDDPCYVGLVRTYGPGGHADSESVRFAVVRQP